MIDVGECVIVVNSGKTYSAYKGMAEKLGASNWAEEETPEKFIKARVLSIHIPTTVKGDKIALIEMVEGIATGKQYVIGVTGLKKVNESRCTSLW